MTVVRRLRPGEEPAFLELLDGWPFSDGRRGSEFFRKYVDDDHRYSPDNVWVAEESGALVTCVQIFPRELRIGDVIATAGGIGSVFTAASHRRQGLAEQVLEACTLDMAQRGMSLSLLSGTRARWYSSLGWRPWPSQSHRLRWNGGPVEPADAFRDSDLQGVVALHSEYSAGRPGCVERTAADWESSLRIAGNPNETFTVARRTGRPVAYLRTAPLGAGLVTEWGRSAEYAHELARLLAHATSGQPEGSLQCPRLGDDDLERALGELGLEIDTEQDPTDYQEDPKKPVWMLKPLDSGSWRIANHEELETQLPFDDFRFWPADRF